jgi:RNA binding exosome subunit
MYLTMCGRQQKVSRTGEEYGWSSTVFCTTESFFGEEVFVKALNIDEKEAISKITEQILQLNPQADSKKIIKFIKG